MDLEPVPETREALLNLGRGSEHDLIAELTQQGQAVQAVVPSLSGLSLALTKEGLTFTLAATQEQLAVLDAVKVAVEGPGVDAVVLDSVMVSGDSGQGLLDEGRWVHFARRGAAHGVLSSLSMPVHLRGRVVGGVNLYAAAPDAFVGKHEALAAIMGAWAPGAIKNADLSFSSRTEARNAPTVLDERQVLDHATGVLVARRGVQEHVARRLIAEAARHSGQTEVEVARALVSPFTRDEDSPR